MLKLLRILLSEFPCKVKHPVSVHSHHCVIWYCLDSIAMHSTAYKFIPLMRDSPCKYEAPYPVSVKMLCTLKKIVNEHYRISAATFIYPENKGTSP